MFETIWVALIVAVADLSVVLADGFEAAIHAPVANDIAFEQAHKLAAEEAARARSCENESKKKSAEVSNVPCFGTAAVSLHSCWRGLWASPDVLLDGQEALSYLQGHAVDGTPFTDGGDPVVMVVDTDSPPQEQHIALCQVKVVNGKAGPPHDCSTVAIVTQHGTVLRSVAPMKGGCVSSGLSVLRLSGAIDIKLEVETTLDAREFSNSLKRMLEDDLGFSVDESMFDTDGKLVFVSLAGTAPLRDSVILPRGWRESIDFDIRISPSHTGYVVEGTTRPLVSRRADGNRVNYHGPTDAQSALYAATLDGKVRTALSRPCKVATKLDDRRIKCL